MGHLHPIFHTGSPSAGRLVLGLADHPALDLAAADLASLAQARWEVHGGGVWKTMDWVGKSTGNVGDQGFNLADVPLNQFPERGVPTILLILL